MVDRFEMMTCNSEQVVNRSVGGEKSLNLCRRFEAPHLAFLLLANHVVGAKPFSGACIMNIGSNGWRHEAQMELLRTTGYSGEVSLHKSWGCLSF